MLQETYQSVTQNWFRPSKPLQVAYLASFLPRKCGIATFTSDLVGAIDGVEPQHIPRIYAMQERDEFCAYANVAGVLDPDDTRAYIRAANDINAGPAQLLNIQHEFGLFGGVYGAHLLTLMDRVRKPMMTTFHTVLSSPDPDLRSVVLAISERSSAVIVLSRQAVEILEHEYGVDRRKVRVIPHGVPAVPAEGQERHKAALGLEGRSVLATFGLLNADKGIEHALEALPAIVERNPNVLYLVLGETHPGVRRLTGEAYRMKLLDHVERLGLNEHVRFSNQFLDNSELIDYLMATDVLLVLNQNMQQYCSGTLAYAVGCGRAVVATPFRYARELLGEGRGILVDQRDPEGIARAINTILGSPWYKSELERMTYLYGRQMQWPEVGRDYVNLTRSLIGAKEESRPIAIESRMPAFIGGGSSDLVDDDERAHAKR